MAALEDIMAALEDIAVAPDLAVAIITDPRWVAVCITSPQWVVVCGTAHLAATEAAAAVCSQ